MSQASFKQLFYFYIILTIFYGCSPSPDDTGSSISTAPINLMMISLDTLRPDRLGAYGCPDATSPFLDRLLQKSICFSDMLAQVPSTVGSHRCIFSSNYFDELRVKIPDSGRTIAGGLKNIGYTTAAFTDGGLMNHTYMENSGFDLYNDEGNGLPAIWPKAIKWLEENRNKTTCLFIHTYDIHCPYDPNSPYIDMFIDPDKIWFEWKHKCGGNYYNRLLMKKSDYRMIRNLYDAGIRETDSWIMQFFMEVTKMGMLRDTLIVVFSDHGESLGERKFVGHNQLYETQLRVLGSVLIPAKTPWIVSYPAQTIDLASTIYSCLNIKPLESFAGIDLQPYFFKPQTDSIQRLRISESLGRSYRLNNTWKLILRRSPDLDELYHLDSDTEELTNIAKEHPEIVEEMMQEVFKATGKDIAELRLPIRRVEQAVPGQFRKKDDTVQPTASPEDEKLKEQLLRLGYIE